MADSSAKQIKYGAIISYSALGINILASLLYTPWMIHQIGTANYGLYTLAISFISLFLVDFGMSAALSRFLAKYRAEGNEYEAKRVLGATYTVYIAIDLLILISLAAVYFNIEYIYRELTHDELKVFKLIFLMVGTFNLISFPMITQNGILMSYERFIELKVADLCRKFLAIAFVVLALMNKMGVIAVVAANIMAELITIICKWVIIRRKVPLKPSYRNLTRDVFKGIFSFSVWMTVISFAQKFVYNIAPTILGIVAGALAIAVYGPASSLGGYFFALAAAVNGLFLPYVSRKINDNNNEDINRLMVEMARFQFLLLGWVYVCFVCAGRMFIRLWLGEDFDLTYFCTLLVLLPALFEYSQQIGCTVIVAKNKVKIQAIGFITISIVTLGISFALGALWGAVGVCLSICLAGFGNVVLQNLIFSRKLDLDMKRYYRQAVGPSLIPIIGAIAIGLFAMAPVSYSWLNFALCCVALSVLYLTLTYFFNRPVLTFLISALKKK